MDMPSPKSMEENIYEMLFQLFTNPIMNTQVCQKSNCWVKNDIFDKIQISHEFTLMCYGLRNQIKYQLFFYYNLAFALPTEYDELDNKIYTAHTNNLFQWKKSVTIGMLENSREKYEVEKVDEIKNSLKETIQSIFHQIYQFREKLKKRDYYYDRIFNQIYFDLSLPNVKSNIITLQMSNYYQELDLIVKIGECGICQENCRKTNVCSCNNFLCYPCLSKIHPPKCPFCRNQFYLELIMNDHFEDD